MHYLNIRFSLFLLKICDVTLWPPPKLHPGLLPLPQRAWRDLWTIPNVSNVLWATVVTLIVRNPDRAEEKKNIRRRLLRWIFRILKFRYRKRKCIKNSSFWCIFWQYFRTTKTVILGPLLWLCNIILFPYFTASTQKIFNQNLELFFVISTKLQNFNTKYQKLVLILCHLILNNNATCAAACCGS